ncbi:hypothetical protein HGP17_04135 [Rhizobium sp. P38BS-XIX]|uniref:hypothetical protein n=1 Tax=Rhizobium sp. P38BS-XIX TaxID=2726740 RepID=UPI0014568744|nr:hypothetical protein [Rhizobium sp. P38BS-XIX]NLR96016.1 hypothetical protein [Rhizobium sp. P38BS-XIX]
MTENTNRIANRKVMRGRPYSIVEFARKYRLDDAEARRLFYKFGPSSTELDLLMAAKRRPPTLSAAIGQ